MDNTMAGITSTVNSTVNNDISSVKKSDVSGKTVGNPKLSEKASKYYEQLKKKFSNMDFVLVSSDMGCKRITVSDIAYIEAMKDNCVIHMIDGKCYTQSCPMGDIEPELNPNMFKRIHRSFIVNIRYIDMYYYGHVVLENGMEVHIGDKYRDALKSSFHFWGSRNRNK